MLYVRFGGPNPQSYFAHHNENKKNQIVLFGTKIERCYSAWNSSALMEDSHTPSEGFGRSVWKALRELNAVRNALLHEVEVDGLSASWLNNLFSPAARRELFVEKYLWCVKQLEDLADLRDAAELKLREEGNARLAEALEAEIAKERQLMERWGSREERDARCYADFRRAGDDFFDSSAAMTKIKKKYYTGRIAKGHESTQGMRASTRGECGGGTQSSWDEDEAGDKAPTDWVPDSWEEHYEGGGANNLFSALHGSSSNNSSNARLRRTDSGGHMFAAAPTQAEPPVTAWARGPPTTMPAAPPERARGAGRDASWGTRAAAGDDDDDLFNGGLLGGWQTARGGRHR